MLLLCLLPSGDKIEFYNKLDITENVTFHNRRAQSQDLRVGAPRYVCICYILFSCLSLFVTLMFNTHTNNEFLLGILYL